MNSLFVALKTEHNFTLQKLLINLSKSKSKFNDLFLAIVFKETFPFSDIRKKTFDILTYSGT